MKYITVYLLTILSMTSSIHAKLDKLMRELLADPKKYETPVNKLNRGNYVAPTANPNYVNLIEKYLPDIKDTLYNSCAPILKRAGSLSLASVEALTTATSNLANIIDQYMEYKIYERTKANESSGGSSETLKASKIFAGLKAGA